MYFAYNQLNEPHFPYKKVIIMDKTSNISTLTTIGIDRQTGKLIDKLCKRYLLKKGEIVRLWKIQCKLPPKTKRFCPLVLK